MSLIKTKPFTKKKKETEANPTDDLKSFSDTQQKMNTQNHAQKKKEETNRDAKHGMIFEFMCETLGSIAEHITQFFF